MIFLRHPRPLVEAGICYGRLDIDIHPDGHAQIEAALLATPLTRRVVASPALRCRRLAKAIARRDGLTPEFDERLWEMSMGDWEGLAWDIIPRSLSEPWSRDPYNLPCPGGECFQDLQRRVLEALDELDEDTAVICHAGPIRAAQMAWLGLTYAEAFANQPPFAEPIILRRPEAALQPSAPKAQGMSGRR